MLPHFLFKFLGKKGKKENQKKNPAYLHLSSYPYFHSHLPSLPPPLLPPPPLPPPHSHLHFHSHLHYLHSYSCLCLCSLRSNCSFCFCHTLHRWSVTLCAPPHAAHLLGPPGQSLVSCPPSHLLHLGLVALHLL